jgi:hypothetical protein
VLSRFGAASAQRLRAALPTTIRLW